MKEFFHTEGAAEQKLENPEEFIEVFEEVNKIFARQTVSRLDVSDISALPLVSTSPAFTPFLAVSLPLMLIATCLVPYFL